MKKSIGFIGGGRVTKILLRSFMNESAAFQRVVVAEPNQEVRDKLNKLFPFIHFEDSSVAASQDIVFISLHPPVILDTLESVKNQFKAGSVVISLAPKITIGKISSKLVHVKNIARLIPNATSFINEGYNPVCFSLDFASKEKQNVLKLLTLRGNTFKVPEEKLES